MKTRLVTDLREEDFTLPSGELFHGPIRYRDVEFMAASFLASAEGVRELIPRADLEPALFLPGRAVVTLAALEYRWVGDNRGNEIEPYNELLAMIPVLHRPRINPVAVPLFFPDRFESFGLYVRHIPVTTARARDLGVQMFGLPKIVAEIAFEDTESLRRCRLRANGEDVLTLTVEKLRVRPCHMANRHYSVRDGRLRRFMFEGFGRAGILRLRGGASCTLGQHPIADELRRARLGHTAIRRDYGSGIQGILHRPQELRGGAWVESLSAGPASGAAASGAGV